MVSDAANEATPDSTSAASLDSSTGGRAPEPTASTRPSVEPATLLHDDEEQAVVTALTLEYPSTAAEPELAAS